ncbi:GGDEF-domain containing protein, partial [Bradyrhizobium sp. Arg68]|nr:GGDEF-domain containing protein [Bradyrhizobium ivorense]
MPPVPPAASILASLGQATFAWDLATDAIAWSDNVAAVFPDIPEAALASGAELAALIEPQRGIRREALGQGA